MTRRDSIRRVQDMEISARQSAQSAQEHAKRNKDSRNADRARHWVAIAESHLADAEALAEVLADVESRRG